MKSILICQYIGIKHSRQIIKVSRGMDVSGSFRLIHSDNGRIRNLKRNCHVVWYLLEKKLLLLESYTSCEGRIERRRLQTVNAAKYM